MTNVIPIVIGTYYNAYSLLRSFGENGIKSILITQGEKNFVQKSKYAKKVITVNDANINEKAFIEDLLKLGKEIAPNKGMFFPTHDEQLLSIAKNKKILEQYFEIPFSDYETLNKIMDKDLFSEKCRELEIPTIRDYKVKSFEDAEKALADFGMPILVKINQWDINIIKAFGTKIAVYEQEIEYLKAMKHFFEVIPNGEILVQEYIQDSEQLMPNVNSFTDREGNIQCVFVSEKVRQYPPQKGTSTATYSVDPENPKYTDIIEYSKKICKAFKFYGLFGIEYKYDPKDNLYKIIEMNCRSEFPNYLQTIVGQNMAFEIYKYHLGKNVTIPFYPIIKKAACFVPLLDRFYVTKSNKYNYPNFIMSYKEWKATIIKPYTLYGLTIKDFVAYVNAYFLALKYAIITLFRIKNNIPENISTKQFIRKCLRNISDNASHEISKN